MSSPDDSNEETRVVPTAEPTQVGVPQYAQDPQHAQDSPDSQHSQPRYPGQPYPGQLHSGQPLPPPEPTPWSPPPPPPTRPEHTGRWVAGLTAVIVVVLGVLGGGAWLVVRALGPSVPAGFRAVETPYLRYAVPADWTPVDGRAARILGVEFTGGADAPSYECRGDGYKRGTATSTLVRTDSDVAAVAEQFANQLGRSFYTDTAGHVPQVALAAPQAVTVGGATGAVVEATVTTPVDDGCLATGGTVAVLAVPVEGGGTALLVANVDTVGGPASSPVPDPGVVTQILESAG